MVLEMNNGIGNNMDSCKQIILKYMKSRRSGIVHTTINHEILGYMYMRLAKENANPVIASIIQSSPFQEGILSEDEIKILLDNKSFVAEYLCSPSDRVSRYAAEFMQPKELTEVAIAALKDLPDGATVYNPYAGVNSYAIAAPQYHFVGEELSLNTWALGQMRLYMHGINADIKLADSFRRGYWRRPIFDAIICTPPFLGMRDEFEHLNALLDELNDGGRLVLVYTSKLLFDVNGTLRTLRSILVGNRWVKSIVLLPQNIFYGTGVQSALVVIEKKQHQSIRMIDGSNSCDQASNGASRINRLNSGELIDLLLSDSTNANAINVAYEDVRDDDNLQPSLYLMKSRIANCAFVNRAFVNRGFVSLVKLSDILTIYRGRRVDSSYGPVRLIRSTHISDNIATAIKDFSELEPESLNGSHRLLEKDNLLLVSKIGDKFKCSIFRKKEGMNIACHNIISVYELNSDSTNIEYLVSELYEDYIQDQVDALCTSMFPRQITTTRFLDVQINIPKMTAAQNAEYMQRVLSERKINAQEELLKKTGLQLEQLQNKELNNFVRTMRVRKHAIAQVLNSVAPAIDVLKMTLEKNGGILKSSDVILRRSGTTLDGYLDKLQDQVNKIVTMVDVLTDGTEYGAPSEVSLYELIENYKGKLIEDKFSFVVVYTSESGFFIDKGSDQYSQHYTDYKLSIDPKDFYQLLDNIISNAKKYGFVQSNQDYTIQISAMPYQLNGKDAVLLSIMNNGESLAKGMTPEKVFLIGEHAGKGDGIGGWQMKNLVEHYGGTIDLVNRTDDESYFKIEYQIVLPIIESYEV